MALSFKKRFYIMAFIKRCKNADTEEAEAIKKLLKNKVYEEMKQEEIDKILAEFNEYEKQDKINNMQILDKLYKDMIADAEAEKKKFHFKRTRKKDAEFEAKLKKLQEQNEQKLKDALK